MFLGQVLLTIIKCEDMNIMNSCLQNTFEIMMLLFMQRGPESEEGSSDSPTPVAASPEQYIKHPLQNR